MNSALAELHITPQKYKNLSHILSTLNIKSQEEFKVNAKGTVIFGSLTSGELDDWFNLSPLLDNTEGVRTEEVYKRYGLPPIENEVIVAVIDSGVDVNHEDLQGKIWINKKEIPSNGIDDDGNGYVDDVFGWNFIGGEKGMATIVEDQSNPNGFTLIKGDPKYQVDSDSYEVARVYKMLLDKMNSKEKLSNKERELLKEVKGKVESRRNEALNNIKTYSSLQDSYLEAEAILRASGLKEINFKTVSSFKARTKDEIFAKKTLLDLLGKGLTIKEINKTLIELNKTAYISYNPYYTGREEIVSDNYADTKERHYGNNDVIGPNSSHGTHVAGIIAANRDNNIGINGVATNVKIMPIRVVPDGDERDKDIANGIRYAVDNGAKVINMSFGKVYSTHKKAVDEAVKYAEEKGVLLVHSAGNSYANNDFVDHFPNREYLNSKNEAKNFLEIAASSSEKGNYLAASFSNYGKKSVDIFAPGVSIKSTIPNNKYAVYSGTSMAAPVASGVAALLLSYKPNLNAAVLREIIMKTARTYPDLIVTKTRVGEIPFSKLSISEGIVDAYEALEFALREFP